MDFEAHINGIAKMHGVAVEIAKSGYAGRAWRKTRKIKIPPAKTSITYALALHELGHVLGEQTGHRVHKEWQAWKWAMANALDWTDSMEAKMQRSLASYLKWCKRRKGVWVPPSDHPVWAMAGHPFQGGNAPC